MNSAGSYIFRHCSKCRSAVSLVHPKFSISSRCVAQQTAFIPDRGRVSESYSPGERSRRTDDFAAVFGTNGRPPRLNDSDTFGTLNRPVRSAGRRPYGPPRSRRLHADNVADPELRPLVMEREFFGTMEDPEWPKREINAAEEDDQEGENIPFRQRPYWYMIQLQKFIKADDLRGALEFFEVRMRGQDHARPLRSVYNMMIAACGRAGYITKAFQFYDDMKRHRFDPLDATYVGLFNACAECPNPKEGLQKARELRAELEEAAHIPNQPVYHSMIKAFGKCGDLAAAFQLADEMTSNQVELAPETFSFLFMACISDRRSGFKHAVEVWRFMIKSAIKPEIYHYSLLLRALRDCGLGPTEVANELLPPSTRLQLSGSDSSSTSTAATTTKPPEYETVDRSKLLPPPAISVTNQCLAEMDDTKVEHGRMLAGELPVESAVRNKSTLGQYQSVMRDLLAERYEEKQAIKRGEWWDRKSQSGLPSELRPSYLSASYGTVLMGSTAIPDLLLPFALQGNTGVIAIGNARNPQERLTLLGGYSGILSRMQRDNVKPDRKVLSMLVDVLPNDQDAEMKLIELGDKIIRKGLDVDFYNQIIVKRNLRKDFNAAMDILRLFQSKGILPNERTFSALALGVIAVAKAKQYFRGMEELNVYPNVMHMKTLIQRACQQNDPMLVLFLMKKMKELNIMPNMTILQTLDNWKDETQKAIVKDEKARRDDTVFSTEAFKTGWTSFKEQYETWLKKQPAPVPQDPYAPYKYEQVTESLDERRKGKIFIRSLFDTEEEH